MIAAISILLAAAVGFVCSAKYKKRVWKEESGKKTVYEIFYPMALWIIESFRRHGVDLCREKNAVTIRNRNLLGGEDNNLRYTVRKLSQAIMVMLAACVLAVLYFAGTGGEGALSVLTRPGYGSEPLVVSFNINGEPVQLDLQPVIYDKDTVEQNFVAAYELLLETIIGENSDLMQVESALNLVTYLEEYAMTVSWYSVDEVIDSTGMVYNRYFEENEERAVALTAELSCQEYSCIYEIDVMVVAPKLTRQERIVRTAEALIQERNEQERLSREIELPKVVEGEEITYQKQEDYYDWLFVLGGIVAGVTVLFGRDSDLRKEDKNRYNQMMIDYPEIVSKLTILMGAGMSVRRAWEKIVEDYRKKGVPRYAYEEMAITCYELKSGEIEGIAYSRFGKRCNIHEYLKLGAMLEQNVKSGTKGLAAMLEAEAWLAFEVRKNTAVKLGEEAGTRLLMPMILMLAVVLVIVMVPALMSLGM